AQYQLRSLHQKVRQSIRQRQRLADAGEAVAKINHDLRNMLSSILLVTKQLESSADPQVAQVAPVVILATEQATELCQNMLDLFI
ncbi:MAG: histidine kinase dimerization/phospho-acceptor domain-containing protein, partial [Alphaproteobacteria bacterium]|nr:histidine kinase dimerization/phospho-acceptor domain-containing protein [Alphaproteobacteria bacterium]